MEALLASYQSACDKQNIKPIPKVVQQLKVCHETDNQFIGNWYITDWWTS